MTTFLHTMVRITDPERSRAFYTALGFEPGHESPIVRNGELEATNYFFGVGGMPDVLELTLNHDGRTYDNGTGYGHIAIGVWTSTPRWRSSRRRASSRSARRTRSATAARGCASCATRMTTGWRSSSERNARRHVSWARA